MKRASDERAERALDLVVAIPALLLAAPIIAAAAIAIKVDSRGPVFYHGVRVGRDGSRFAIHKLRTMQVDAEAAGPGVTARRDPRVTRVGHVLRRTKLDELPQLVNVVVGEMSLVGPRPEHPEYVSRYTQEQRRLLGVRPGITGPASLAYIDEEEQLRGPDPEETYVTDVLPRKLRLELEYLEHDSPAMRVKVLARTAGAIVRRPFASLRGGRGRSRSQPE